MEHLLHHIRSRGWNWAAAFVLLFLHSNAYAAGLTVVDELRPALMLSTVIYAVIGMVVFGVAFMIFNKLMPFSVRKEIEADQNVALAIIIGAMLIGLAIIIASAMH